MLDLLCEDIVQADGFASLKGFDADIELFKGERLSQSSVLGVLKSVYLLVLAVWWWISR